MATCLASQAAFVRGTQLRSSSVAGPVARGSRLVVRAERYGSWFPGSKLPDYTKNLVGDTGFDPCGLGKNPETLKWYVQAELQNGRWAMLGVAGILGQELLSKVGFSYPGCDSSIPWWKAGAQDFFAPSAALFMVQLWLFHWVELRRYQDILKPGSVNGDPIFTNQKLPDNNQPGYPGGIFDPLNMASPEMKLKEIKNARLAMVAAAGMFAQAQVTGATPLSNLANHLADPWAHNVFGNELARVAGSGVAP